MNKSELEEMADQLEEAAKTLARAYDSSSLGRVPGPRTQNAILGTDLFLRLSAMRLRQRASTGLTYRESTDEHIPE